MSQENATPAVDLKSRIDAELEAVNTQVQEKMKEFKSFSWHNFRKAGVNKLTNKSKALESFAKKYEKLEADFAEYLKKAEEEANEPEENAEAEQTGEQA